MNENRRIWGFVAGIIMIMLIFTTMGFINQRGGVSMKTEYVKASNGVSQWKLITVAGVSAAGTSTIYNRAAHTLFGLGWDIDQGTSTPHLRIEWFEGVGEDKENISWEVVPAGTITASDETSVHPSVVTFSPAVTQWIRFRYVATAGNADGTTLTAWLVWQ